MTSDTPSRSFCAEPWIPIRSISPEQRDHVAIHLTSLDSGDRFLRFGLQASDDQIAHYVARLDFERDQIFGIFNRRLELVALAHLANAVATEPDSGAKEAELGVSVLPRYRGRGFGKRLFARAALHARNQGVDTLVIHALSQNRAMLGIVRGAGATVRQEGAETTSRLSLPHHTWASRIDEMASSQAAEIDYRLKEQALNLNGLAEGLAEVRRSVGDARIAVE